MIVADYRRGVATDGIVREGTKVIIACSVYFARPGQHHFYWTEKYYDRNHDATQSKKPVIVCQGERSYYVIANSTRRDSGLYSCHAEDTECGLCFSGSVALKVQGKFSPLGHVVTLQ